MIIKCYNENHPYLLFIDLEFCNKEKEKATQLIEFSGLLFKNIDVDTYQLMGSYTGYVTEKVCYPFAEYTAINNSFLEENGIPLKDMVDIIMNDFLGQVPLNELMIITHGLKNDRLVMLENGLNLSTYNNKPIDGYCTFTNARRILERTNHLTLNDIAEEAGYYLHNAHNAYQDVWAEVSIFTYLKKIEAQKGMK